MQLIYTNNALIIDKDLLLQVPSLNNIIGIISGNQGSVLKQVLDVTRQYSLTTVATIASQSYISTDSHYSNLISLSSSNAAYVSFLKELI